MFQALCRLGRKIALIVVMVGSLASMFVSFASTVYIICVVNVMVALIVMFFRSEMDEDRVTVTVTMYIIAALMFFTLALILSRVPLFMVAISIAMAGIVTYVMARFMHKCDPRCSIGICFVMMLPFGSLIIEALALMSPRKREG